MSLVQINPQVSLSAQADYVTLDTIGPEYDPKWRYTDKQGHAHSGEDLHATLLDVTFTQYDEDDETWEAHDHWECRICGEHIEPGTWYPGPRQVETNRTYTATIRDGETTAIYLLSKATTEAIIGADPANARTVIEAEGTLIQVDYFR